MRNATFLGLLLSSLVLLFGGPLAAHGPGEHVDPATLPALQDGEPIDESDESEDSSSESSNESSKETWDVQDPPEAFGPRREISLDVTSGTWMSLDVSPDGSEIVFDLLGDLYLLPIEGGEARPITSGMGWDMQPRFHPDGQVIAFTSDRGGGDNLWLVDRDGSNPRAVTEESFRLLNSPAWTPDGEFLAARKHFTSQRSLGAGEIWLYHRSGGSGLQMVERPNDQKDLGEPALSPDGRYLYFSQDVTPGSTFEYNKDPNAGIYAIRRLDRETGRVDTVTGGPGGAIRPTPSPDGSTLAFLRRERGDNVLFLRDLTSGAERPVHRGLDRDMQETWAIHGVYPAMAWTPDSRALLFWSGGHIQRLDVDSGDVSTLPFHVKDTREIAPAVRFPVEVHPETFPLRMLRWVTVSPDGSRVAFEALGKIWLRTLPDGTARRLTTPDEDRHEMYPAFSRDGRHLAFTTWNDEDLGAVRIVPVDGGAERVLTPEPGHYVEPAVSPDGASVVYRKVEGGFLRTPTWSQDPGIYRVPLEDGADSAPVLVTRDGVAPHFGADSERLYVLRFQAEGRRALVSVNRHGEDERTHWVSDKATEFRVSPDGRRVAFREGFAAFVAPLVATGRSQTLGPKSRAVPVTRVSDDAGEYLHWSGDGRKLHWALGPALSTLEVDGLWERGAEEDADQKPEPVTVALGFDVESDRPEGVLALVGGRILTMRPDRPEEVIEDGALVIERDRIVAVGPRAEVPIPEAAHVLDVTGKTLMPGLVDVHWHDRFGSDGIIPQHPWPGYASLAFGVTTIHDPSNDTETIFAAAQMARAGLLTAPRLFSTGTILYGADASVRANIETLEDARFHVEKLQAVGAVSVKSYNQPRRDQRQKILAAAREAEIMVVPEGGSLFHHDMTMVVDGHTGIEHSIPVGAVYDDVRQLWSAASGVGYTPTLVVGFGGLWGENYWYAETDVWKNDRLLRFVPRETVDARSRRRIVAPDDEWGHFANARVAAQLQDLGIGVQIGAHGQREGLGAHWELWMLGQGGMEPFEALRAATLDGARYVGLDADVGSLERGKLADVLVLDANPLEDLRHTTSIERVVHGGRVYDADTMDQLHPEAEPRPPFFWQREHGFPTP